MNDLIETKYTPAPVWEAGIESKYFTYEDWKPWAENQILHKGMVDDWVISLYSSIDPNDVLEAILASYSNMNWIEGYNSSNLFFGFVYLSLKEQKISLKDFYKLIWDKFEDEGYGPLGSQHFRIKQILLNDNLGTDEKDKAYKELEDLYHPYVEMANNALEMLNIS